MTSIYTPEPLSVEAVFQDTGNFYEVPIYQRPYSWGEEEVNELWDDLSQASDSSAEEYFLGSLIVVRNNKDDPYQVIDGQQRLVTLTLLFCAIRDFSDIKEDGLLEDIRDCIKKRAKERVILHSRSDEHIKFNEVLQGLDRDKLKEYRKGNNLFFDNVRIFCEKIDKLKEDGGEEALQKFIDYVFTQVTFIRITCSDLASSIRLFRTINARGLDLTPADLVRSFLMGLPDVERHHHALDSTWKEIEEEAKRMGKHNIVNVLTYYAYFKRPDTTRKELYEEIAKHCKDLRGDQVLVFLSDIQKFWHGYEKAYTQSNSIPRQIIDSLTWLPHNPYWRTLLCTVVYQGWTGEDILKMLREIQKFFYMFWIAGYTSGTIKGYSHAAVRKIKEGDDLSSLKQFFQEKIEEKNVIQRCQEALGDNVYGKRWLKPLFGILDQQLVEPDSSKKIELIPDDAWVEHILSQTPGANNPFEGGQEGWDKVMHKLPNLTPLSGKKNIRASSRDYSEKIKIYSGESDGKVTPWRLTEKVAADYDKWTKAEFNDRAEKLAKSINEVFDEPIYKPEPN